MIKNETFTLDWVKQVNQEEGWRRKDDQFKNLEKAIMALKLLETLKLNDIEFVFKGGTSLLLLLEKLYRFSVDIDIIIESGGNYIEKFDSVCKGIFTHWDEQVRNIDKKSKTKHYRFYYKRFRNIYMSGEYVDSLIGKAEKEAYQILLAHNPEYFDTYAVWGADLILSGHVHGGIMRLPVFGGVLSPKLVFFPKYDGGHFAKNGSHMVLSRGLGMHTIPIRIFNPAELVIVHLRPKR